MITCDKCRYWDGYYCKNPSDYVNDKGESVCGMRDDAIPVPGEKLGISPERLEELLRAEQEVRLVVLPCKVGDTVYTITRCADIMKHYDNDYINGTGAIECPYEYEECCIYDECNDEQTQVLETICTGFWFSDDVLDGIFLENISSETYISDFGKTVFLTREEAEAALSKAGGPE